MAVLPIRLRVGYSLIDGVLLKSRALCIARGRNIILSLQPWFTCHPLFVTTACYCFFCGPTVPAGTPRRKCRHVSVAPATTVQHSQHIADQLFDYAACRQRIYITVRSSGSRDNGNHGQSSLKRQQADHKKRTPTQTVFFLF